VPVGNIDICPTLGHLLHLETGTACEGRVLEEALCGWTAPDPTWRTREVTASFVARGRRWRQRAWFDQVYDAAYLAGGAVEPE
jgi:hypothetical protein